MKTTILISGAAAALAANCVRQIAQDNGVRIPDQIMDQLPSILIATAGMLSGFLGWLCHRHDKTTQTATINSLVASNQMLAAASPLSTVQPPK